MMPEIRFGTAEARGQKKFRSFGFFTDNSYICPSVPGEPCGRNRKTMKKFLCFLMSALVAVTLCNCGGGDDPVPDPNPNPGPTPPGPVVEITLQNIVGEWQLTAWSGGSIIDGAHTAYLKLNTDKTFDLYQVRINNQGVVPYEGTFTLDEAQALISGRYSDNVAWGASYTIALSTNAMTWTVVGKNDTSTFTKKNIPADIIDIAVPADEVRSLGELRLL